MIQGVTSLQLDFIRASIVRFFPHARIRFFGSRVLGTPHRYSDLDLCIDISVPMDLAQWAQLEDVFSESDLPFKIDLVDYHRITPEFRGIIEATPGGWESLTPKLRTPSI